MGASHSLPRVQIVQTVMDGRRKRQYQTLVRHQRLPWGHWGQKILSPMLIPPFYHRGINQVGLQTRAKRLDSHELAHADHKQLTHPSSQPSKVELLINLAMSTIY
jgi:hypothetical protein